jgi:ankyrin repeat protein
VQSDTLRAQSGALRLQQVQAQLSADKEAKDAYGATPLHSSAGDGQVEAIKVQAQLGADKEAKDAYGATPLHACTWRLSLVVLVTHL